MSDQSNVDLPESGTPQSHDSQEAYALFDGLELNLAETASVDMSKFFSYFVREEQKPTSDVRPPDDVMSSGTGASIMNASSGSRIHTQATSSQSLWGNETFTPKTAEMGDFVDGSPRVFTSSSANRLPPSRFEDCSDANRCIRRKELDKYWIKALEQHANENADEGGQNVGCKSNAESGGSDESRVDGLLKALRDKERRYVQKEGLAGRVLLTYTDSYFLDQHTKLVTNDDVGSEEPNFFNLLEQNLRFPL